MHRANSILCIVAENYTHSCCIFNCTQEKNDAYEKIGLPIRYKPFPETVNFYQINAHFIVYVFMCSLLETYNVNKCMFGSLQNSFR